MDRYLVCGLLSVVLFSTYSANGASIHNDPFFKTKAGRAHLASKSSSPSISSGQAPTSGAFHSKPGGGQKIHAIGRRNNSDECMADADIILSFDDSSSIKRDSPENFHKMLNFMREIVSKFGQVGPNNTRFAAVTFSVGVKEHFDLNKYKTKEEIMKGIENIKPTYGGATAMGDALKYVKEKGFRDGRKGVQQIVILATDGKNNGFESPLLYASKLKKRNVAIIPVGIGRGFLLPELKHIATGDKYVLTTDSFSKLASLIDGVVALACDVCPEKKGTAGAAAPTHTFPAPAPAPVPAPAPAPVPLPAPAPVPAPPALTQHVASKMHAWNQQAQMTGSDMQTGGQEPSQMTGTWQQQQPAQMTGSNMQTWDHQPSQSDWGTQTWGHQQQPIAHQTRQWSPPTNTWGHQPQQHGGTNQQQQWQGWK